MTKQDVTIAKGLQTLKELEAAKRLGFHIHNNTQQFVMPSYMLLDSKGQVAVISHSSEYEIYKKLFGKTPVELGKKYGYKTSFNVMDRKFNTQKFKVVQIISNNEITVLCDNGTEITFKK
ncbi:hypothetical protein phiAS5_ORF0084 [Aeromonas phage phiAS5]|uniref:Uncharacterized protein n=1 Tax=Aeromonas phage phiAS5 TaxID=879630 RepID=E1A2I1_9CAUD|nr:hypothetical protein phiAS5_ORF0084 [Aeromonas phage phiAS5]ADM79927.1 hypothetical protein phiAS5_ORF0084 [Aeromonas phage phiAS5]BES53301.1 hypothetical protein [Aeromonas phage phiWae14]